MFVFQLEKCTLKTYFPYCSDFHEFLIFYSNETNECGHSAIASTKKQVH